MGGWESDNRGSLWGYLLACGYDGACVAALVDLSKGLRSWGVRVRGLIDGDENILL